MFKMRFFNLDSSARRQVHDPTLRFPPSTTKPALPPAPSPPTPLVRAPPPADLPLGTSIPPHEPHAVSVSLPEWRDVIGYEEGTKRVHDSLQAGYPRFVYASAVQDLFSACRTRFAHPGEDVLVLPTRADADACRAFLVAQHPGTRVRVIEYAVPRVRDARGVRLEVVAFPADLAKTAKAFWQHSGAIVSSRMAEHAMRLIGDAERYPRTVEPHGVAARRCPDPRQSLPGALKSAVDAKRVVKHRIAPYFGAAADDVYLFSCGMNAIWHAHRAVTRLRPGKTVQFGFPYLDTLKIQEKFNQQGVIFLGHGDENDLQTLSTLARDANPPLSAVFCEFPSNPLLKVPPLHEIRDLADKHGFMIVVDDTVASFANVNVLPVADVVVSSLTKVFSGDSNVMGGSMVLNPSSRYYDQLKQQMQTQYEDGLWDDDAIFLEHNSRPFAERVRVINRNTEVVVDFLAKSPLVDRVFYPTLTDRAAYDAFRVATSDSGYGALLSVQFPTEVQAATFYDALHVAKGPSLGTTFTLACPYTIMAHYTELAWAAEFGVCRWLVRISVGTEDVGVLLGILRRALTTVEALPPAVTEQGKVGPVAPPTKAVYGTEVDAHDVLERPHHGRHGMPIRCFPPVASWL
ncbi:hypothetical protein AMAG_13996 [Allomyces macrogynus ATCC 38327]|uniref:Cystathionine gamma-synthase n=1 Tax=Allomyces macrogynus (strain ATCC 38327) TaxID=578462 RepID=A0A0L0T390_ALLM3|nr:hypothetical protein AMAG_13996 [Allomyces macrogynus ATCC 38327]|eukprot:KNE69140.1 hypothetical protein AMAG_13996 [Allomyces macrogynus ATCC 38327]